MDKIKKLLGKDLPDAEDMCWQDVVDKILSCQKEGETCVFPKHVMSPKFIKKLKAKHYTVIKFRHFDFEDYMYRIEWFPLTSEDLEDYEEIM